MNEYFVASVKLHQYLQEKYWNGGALVGPTLGNKYHRHTIRLLRSYFPSISREKKILYQGLGYWIKSNWRLFDKLRAPKYREIALACSDFIVNSQNMKGNWPFPQHLMKCSINTNDGTWASLGLLETYGRTKEDKYLASVLKWYHLLTTDVGFQKYKGTSTINYSCPPSGVVPNNTTFVLWFFAELSRLTGNQDYMEKTQEMINFLKLAQMKNGELMYSNKTSHYLCFQYNAFQFLDLLEFYRLTSDVVVYNIMQKLIEFISTGVNEDGSVRFNCFRKYPQVIYYAAVVGCALLQATQIGVGDFSNLAERVYNFVLSAQKPDGGFPYSSREYWVFSDRTAYPYINGYTLYHLLTKTEC